MTIRALPPCGGLQLKFINCKFCGIIVILCKRKKKNGELWIGEEKVQRMPAINAFKLLPAMLGSRCRSKKEQQKGEEECVSGIKREICVHAHFNFVNFSPSSSSAQWMLTRMAMMELERLKNQHLILLFAVSLNYICCNVPLYECICS